MFKDLRHLFQVMNESGLNYVVMRNFESLPDNAVVDDHLDIDILTDDYKSMKELVNGESASSPMVENGGYRILNYIKVGNKKIMMDIRYVGDNYYCEDLEKDMLSSREFDEARGIWTPDKEYHLYGLIYHGLVHKHRVSLTYRKIFKEHKIEYNNLKTSLDSWMDEKGYEYVRPNDKSVGFNNVEEWKRPRNE